MNLTVIVSDFLQCMGIVTLVALGFDEFYKRSSNAAIRWVATILIFVVGGTGSMLTPVDVGGGVLFDLRNVFIALAAAYGGWVALVATALATGTVRALQGGAGVYIGLLAILVAAVVSFVYVRFLPKPPLSAVRLASLGLVSSVSLTSLLLLPAQIGLPIFLEVAPVVMIGNVLGTTIAGLILNRQWARRDREQALTLDATTDSLTGLSNRREFDRAGPKMAESMSLQGEPYSIIVVDIDHFKRINDRTGHVAGDAVLRHIASIISANVRNGDLVARYGGEEIAIVLPRQNVEQGRRIANRIRETIADTPLRFGGETLTATVSVGLFTVRPGGDGFWAAFRKADDALYQAKAAGRNRVELASAA